MVIENKFFVIFALIPLLASCSKNENDIVCGGACPEITFRDYFPNLGDGFFDYLSELQKENQSYITKLKKRNLECEPCERAEPYDKIVFYKVRPLLNNENVLNINIEYSLYIKKNAEYWGVYGRDEDYRSHLYDINFYDFKYNLRFAICDEKNNLISESFVPIVFNETTKLNNENDYYDSWETIEYLSKISTSIVFPSVCEKYYWFKIYLTGEYSDGIFNYTAENNEYYGGEFFVIINENNQNTLLREVYYRFQGVRCFVYQKKINF